MLDKIIGTILKLLQTVKRCSQCFSAICYLAMMIFELEKIIYLSIDDYGEHVSIPLWNANKEGKLGNAFIQKVESIVLKSNKWNGSLNWFMKPFLIIQFDVHRSL